MKYANATFRFGDGHIEEGEVPFVLDFPPLKWALNKVEDVSFFIEPKCCVLMEHRFDLVYYTVQVDVRNGTPLMKCEALYVEKPTA